MLLIFHSNYSVHTFHFSIFLFPTYFYYTMPFSFVIFYNVDRLKDGTLT